MKHIAILLTVILAGCASTTPIIKPQVVEVHHTTYVCPKPPDTVIQPLLLNTINQDTPDGEVAKIYKASILQQQSTIKELLAIIDGYRKLDTTQTDQKK
jgi:hypothetical protein